MSGLNSNFTVKGGPSIAVKKVDSSDASIGKRAARVGDRRGSADKSMKEIANPPGPRDRVGQFPLSRKEPAVKNSTLTKNYEGVGG